MSAVEENRNMDMNIQKYMAFIQTVECGSFTRAADALSYSQSGISRMISDLEKEWNVVLLERGRTGVHLTPSGLKLLPYVRSICHDYQKLQERVDELTGLQSDLIRIGTFSSVATHWLPNILQAFRRDYPGVDYELLIGDYTEIETWVTEERVDLGFLRLPTHADLDSVFLEEDPLLAVLPETHPLAACSKVSLQQLCDETFMLLEKGEQSGLSDLFRENGLSPKVHFITWDDYAIMSMVENNLGVSILPKLILKRIPYHIAIRELDVPAARKIGLVLKDKKTASPAVKKFMEYLQYR